MATRVTIIDDEGRLQLAFVASLRKRNDVHLHLITEPASFDDSIVDLIADGRPDLIVLDLQLLGSTTDEFEGYRVLRRLKASEVLKDVPVVVVSAFIGDEGTRLERKDRVIDLGAVAAFSKSQEPSAEQLLAFARKPTAGVARK